MVGILYIIIISILFELLPVEYIYIYTLPDVLWIYWVSKSGSIYLFSRGREAPEGGLIYTPAFGDPMFP